MAEAPFAAVAVDRAAYHFDQLYTYAVPAALLGKVKPGCRVRVPFGAGKDCMGLVVALQESCAVAAKPVFALLDTAPLLSPELLALVSFLRERCFCTYYEAFRAMVPAGLHAKVRETYSALPAGQCPSEALLTDDERRILAKLRASRLPAFPREKLLRALKLPQDSLLPARLAEAGFLLRSIDVLKEAEEQTERVYSIAEEPDSDVSDVVRPMFRGRQAEVYDFLRKNGAATLREICTYTGVSLSVPQGMERGGFLLSEKRRVWRSAVNAAEPDTPETIALTEEQARAYQNLAAQAQSEDPGTALLFGVTGSGKTSVYLRLIDDCLARERGAIVLVPEIGLTPQLLERFAARYGKRVALLHSALSMGERMDEWNRIREGGAQVAIGTRSAVFAPVPRLGLIILDEEHEHTYKSEQTPRFHAREVARFRASQCGALLLLGSATPRVESYTAALRGRYRLEALEKRYGSAQLPQVRVVDLQLRRRDARSGLLTEELMDELHQTVTAGRQAILLMNRRGYHTFLACDRCAKVLICPQCSISLTYHLANERVRCHYCGYSAPAPTVCPECREPTVRFGGVGTQKLEQELLRLMPELRVARMDADSTAARGAREALLSGFAAGEFDVLLGTQMVAKGLDFPNVTLVGVVSIDQQLYYDDYRSQERAFALLTQVIGRAGRGLQPGLALVQTFNPENEILRLAARQDYRAFYQTEIRLRKQLVYPPYCDFCLLGTAAATEPLARQGAKYLLEQLRRRTAPGAAYADEKLMALGPMPARVGMLKGKYRWRLLIKCRNSPRLRGLISELLCAFGKESAFAQVSSYADMNPEAVL
ncbi:MAG: primosomal protein N' [Oscillospiraceae bacterium]|jgi:primosomal protein N' (replication factor Y)|nr:primosomal protein N' [Oscillospiraceae bacterium]